MKSAEGLMTPPEVAGFANEGYDIPVFKVALHPQVRSKRNACFTPLTDYIRRCIANGIPVSEAMVQSHCGRYPGDSRKALRKVGQCYPHTTRLFLDGGLWVLAPVSEVTRV